MINFILYGRDKKKRESYQSLIDNFFGMNNEKYRIICVENLNDDISKITSSIDGKKVFLIDNTSNLNNKIAFAKKIRDNGDWLSPIIIFTSKNEFNKRNVSSNILMIDFMFNDDNLKSNFIDSIREAHNIVKTHKAFTFQYNGEIYNIPYHDILYFEKEVNNNYTSIITYNKKYTVRKNIVQIENILSNDSRFIKTHRSYIINIHNVSRVSLTDNVVIFSNNKKALISRSRKKFLLQTLEGLINS